MSDCQKAGGTDSVANTIIEKDSFEIQNGYTKYYETTSDRGSKMQRHFCPECGTPIFTMPEAFPEVLSLRVATLDDSSWYKPDLSIYTKDAQNWSLFHEGIEKHSSHQTK